MRVKWFAAVMRSAKDRSAPHAFDDATTNGSQAAEFRLLNPYSWTSASVMTQETVSATRSQSSSTRRRALWAEKATAGFKEDNDDRKADMNFEEQFASNGITPMKCVMCENWGLRIKMRNLRRARRLKATSACEGWAGAGTRGARLLWRFRTEERIMGGGKKEGKRHVCNLWQKCARDLLSTIFQKRNVCGANERQVGSCFR